MRCVALASGSNGNAVYVETSDQRLLFDAGVSGRQLAARAASRRVSLDGLDALLVSHAHSDHVRGAGVVSRRYGLPLYASHATWSGIRTRVGAVEDRRRFRAGATIAFGATRVHTVPTPHDAAGSVAFVVEARGRRLGILTDLGHPFPRLYDILGTLDGVFLESNHAEEMLRSGPYPAWLKARIGGPAGHLSNEECADVLEDAADPRLQFVVLSHLSGNCNTPQRALGRVRRLQKRGLRVCLAPRTAASPLLELES